MTPTQVAPFQREQTYQILLAYAVDGIMLAYVFHSSTDGIVFEDFIEQLLPLCGKWPEPKSVLVMDNTFFYHTERIKQIYYDTRVKLLYLLLYSPDLNPIKEFFVELKAFIKWNWHIYEGNPEQGFGNFLEWCIDIVGAQEQSAKGHFRHVGLTMEKL
jgi:transposase